MRKQEPDTKITKKSISKYGNGKQLLELAKNNDMLLTNTTFPHKMAHRTTLTAPDLIVDRKRYDGTTRRNPYRNQIDYIIVKNSQRMLDPMQDVIHTQTIKWSKWK